MLRLDQRFPLPQVNAAANGTRQHPEQEEDLPSQTNSLYKVGAVIVLVAGAAVAGAAWAPSPVRAACPETECEFKFECAANPGEYTYCQRNDNENSCTTKACEPE